MDALSRIVLVRHGETVGESSIRFHGSRDVQLSQLGREQARRARSAIPGDGFELVVASTLSRAWQTASIVAPGRPIRLEAGFCEIDFGRWEGLTREEIAALDPALYERWQAGGPGFEFPEGETHADFSARVAAGLSRVRKSGAQSVIVVAHKGVVRAIVRLLCGEDLSPEQPPLGGVLRATRQPAGAWRACSCPV